MTSKTAREIFNEVTLQAPELSRDSLSSSRHRALKSAESALP
jgi:vacuolar-type H+-ATPase subunit H